MTAVLIAGWFLVWFGLCVAIGYNPRLCGFPSDEENGEALAIGACLAALWPVLLVTALALCVVAFPVWLGKKLRK